MCKDTVIRLTDITKYYGSYCVLDHFSCSFQKAEFCALTAPSGYGKSTLLSILGLLDYSFGGTCLMFGKNISLLKRREKDLFRNEKIGFVFQHFHLIPHMNVKDNILLPVLYHGCQTKTDFDFFRERTKTLADLFSITRLLEKDIRFLSGGEMQRTAIARALIMDPDLILADEPTGNLDPDNTDLIIRCFSQLSEEGKTVIMATHDASVLPECSRVIVLR